MAQDWQDIRWFAAVLRHGSFSAAARAEGTTQATISRRIKSLEAGIGGLLFTRGTEAVPTPLAEALRGPAEAMANGQTAWSRILEERSRQKRSVIVTCGELIGGFLSTRMEALGHSLEDVDIELRPTNTFVNLEGGEADLALRNVRPERGGLLVRKLVSESYGAFSVFGAKAFFAEREFASVASLQKEAWILPAGTGPRMKSAEWILDHIGEEAIRFRMNSTALVLSAVRRNKALALLPRFIGLEEAELIELYGPVKGLHFDMWVVRRDAGYRDEVLECLIRNIEEIL